MRINIKLIIGSLCILALFNAIALAGKTFDKVSSFDAPELGFVTWDKNQVKVSDLKGKVVVLLFFVTGSADSNKWGPKHLKNLLDSLKEAKLDNSMIILAICTDTDIDTTKAFLEKYNITTGLSIGYDKQDITRRLYGCDPKELWSAAIINPDGTVEYKGFAGQWNKTEETATYAQRAKQIASDKCKSEIDTSKFLKELHLILEEIKFSRFASAVKQLKPLKSKKTPEGLAEQAQTLMNMMEKTAQDKLAEADKLKEDKKPYQAYKIYKWLEIECEAFTEINKKAKEASNESGKSKEVKEEITAQKTLDQIYQQKTAKKIIEICVEVAKKYPDTEAGKSAERINKMLTQ